MQLRFDMTDWGGRILSACYMYVCLFVFCGEKKLPKTLNVNKHQQEKKSSDIGVPEKCCQFLCRNRHNKHVFAGLLHSKISSFQKLKCSWISSPC